MNARLRNLKLGLQTLFSNRPQGFFIPYRYASEVVPQDYPALIPTFEQALPRYEALLGRMSDFAPEFDKFGGAAPNPRFEQDWFPRLDAAAAYAIVRSQKPAKIIEVGSGHSTRVMARAIRDAGKDTEIICFDPSPRAALLDLPVQHFACTLQAADLSTLPCLEAGDIFFVDSSHIAMPGTDVDFIINSVLPGLPRGCLLHFHDVFLPDNYPPKWAWRAYNEQIAVSALVQSGAFELLFASHYIVTRRKDLLNGTVVERLPILQGAIESSLWLRKLSDATYSANQNVSGR